MAFFVPANLAVTVLSSPNTLPPLMTGIGHHHRTIKTSSPLAQRYFDQGLALFYSFHKNQALKSLQQAAKLDPECPMAWWGVAMAVGPDINYTNVDKVNSRIAVEALIKASALSAPLLEWDLIEARRPQALAKQWLVVARTLSGSG